MITEGANTLFANKPKDIYIDLDIIHVHMPTWLPTSWIGYLGNFVDMEDFSSLTAVLNLKYYIWQLFTPSWKRRHELVVNVIYRVVPISKLLGLKWTCLKSPSRPHYLNLSCKPYNTNYVDALICDIYPGARSCAQLAVVFKHNEVF